MNTPYFSVIMPVYNKAPHIRRALTSVLKQSFSELELIIVNDASTDSSLSEIKKFSDRRIRIYNRDAPGAGGYRARNLGIKNSRSEWIAFLDADDEWYPYHLYDAYKMINSEDNVDIVCSGWATKYGNGQLVNNVYYDDNHKKGQHEFTVRDFIYKSRPMWTGVVIAKKKLLDKVGGFDVRWKHGADASLWLNLLLNVDGRAIWNPKITAVYHTNTVNRVTSNQCQNLSPTTELIRWYIKFRPEVLGENKIAFIKYANRKAMDVFFRQLKNKQIKILHARSVFIFSIYDPYHILKLIIYIIVIKKLTSFRAYNQD